VVSAGGIIKGIGGILAVIILIGGGEIGHKIGVGAGLSIGLGFALSCIVSIPIYVLGILVSSQGQTQLAVLDTAINSSRLLQDDDVAKILSKRFSL